MSDAAAGDEAPKKKGGAVKLIIIAVVMLAVGGGGAFGAMQMGLIGPKHEVKEAPKGPQLIKKGEEDPYAPPKKEGGEEGATEEVDGEGGSEFRTAYYSFEEPFTSNLKNSATLIQTSLAASTRRDHRVLMWMKKHELAIRSAILVALADTPEEELFSPAGKDLLQKRLTATINKELIAAEGFGGIDKVYFKGLLVQ